MLVVSIPPPPKELSVSDQNKTPSNGKSREITSRKGSWALHNIEGRKGGCNEDYSCRLREGRPKNVTERPRESWGMPISMRGVLQRMRGDRSMLHMETWQKYGPKRASTALGEVLLCAIFKIHWGHCSSRNGTKEGKNQELTLHGAWCTAAVGTALEIYITKSVWSIHVPGVRENEITELERQ